MDLDLETPELWSATADIASSAATMKVLYMMIVTMTMTAMRHKITVHHYFLVLQETVFGLLKNKAAAAAICFLTTSRRI